MSLLLLFLTSTYPHNGCPDPTQRDLYQRWVVCLNKNGDENACQKARSSMKTLCPSDWYSTWDEERAEGTFGKTIHYDSHNIVHKSDIEFSFLHSWHQISVIYKPSDTIEMPKSDFQIMNTKNCVAFLYIYIYIYLYIYIYTYIQTLRLV